MSLNSPHTTTSLVEPPGPARTVLDAARDRMLVRARDTLNRVGDKLPHWADTDTGKWTVTDDGDWTGGSWPGELWLIALRTADVSWADAASSAERRMRPRLRRRTSFKGYGFYCASVLGWLLHGDEGCRSDALECATDVADMYDPVLGLIPLGDQAEEGSAVGSSESSIDSLQASPLLFWAARETGDAEMERVAHVHTRRVLELHVRDDASVIQSTTLNPADGSVLRHHTHKGYSDDSVWGRAQGWAALYSAWAAMLFPDEPIYEDYARRTIDWWIANVPSDGVSYWDFDDPSIPHAPRDTAATAIVASAMLKLADTLGQRDPQAAQHYSDAALAGVLEMARTYVSHESSAAGAPAGVLTAGCFTLRPDSRAHDLAADSVELVFGRYFLTECLSILCGDFSPSGLNERRGQTREENHAR